MVTIREYLRASTERMPRWLFEYGPGSRFPTREFLRSRVVYYPGSGFDGQPAKLFGSSHSAHSFVYVDYGVTRESLAAQLEDTDHGFSGYRPGPSVSVCGRDLLDAWKEPHFELGEGQPSTRLDPTADECGFLQILDRESGLTDDHGPSRLAILFLITDGIAAYDALFCQTPDRPPPFAVLLHDHGFGGNYDRFGKDGLLARVAERAGVFPEYLLVAKHTQAWDGYRVCRGVEGELGGLTPTIRRLWQR
jgi:hypothetical protein